MSLVVQVDATDEASLDQRVLYVFGCNTARCSAEQAAWSVIRAQRASDAYDEPAEASPVVAPPPKAAAFAVDDGAAWGGGGDAWGAAPEEPKASAWGAEPAAAWGASAEPAGDSWGASAAGSGGFGAGGMDDEISKLLVQRDVALTTVAPVAATEEAASVKEKVGKEAVWGVLVGEEEKCGLRVVLSHHKLRFAWEPEAWKDAAEEAHIQANHTTKPLPLAALNASPFSPLNGSLIRPYDPLHRFFSRNTKPPHLESSLLPYMDT